MSNVADTTDALIQWCGQRGTASGVDEFLEVLHEQNSQHLLPHILRDLEYRQENTKKGRELHVETARPVTDAQIADMKSAFKVLDKTTVTTTINPSLFGGVSCAQNGLQVADTYRGRLQKLQARLQS